MKKSIRLLSLIISIVFIIMQQAFATEELSITEFDYIMELYDVIDTSESQQGYAHNMAEYARLLGYTDDHIIISTAKENWCQAEEIKKYAEKELASWEDKFAEYPVATYIWLYCKSELNYNDYVIAGIMGNLMAEVGGGTLELKYNANSKGYYGICQWSKRYYPYITDTSLIEQCEILGNTIEEELNNFGFCYKRGYKYQDFLDLSDECAAALMFAKAYERCAEESYLARQKNATKAYDYFVN